MTTYDIVDISKVLNKNVLDHIEVQVVFANGSVKLAYTKNLPASAVNTIKEEIEKWAPEILKKFEEYATSIQTPVVTVEKIDASTVVLDKEKIRTEADKLKDAKPADAAAEAIKP